MERWIEARNGMDGRFDGVWFVGGECGSRSLLFHLLPAAASVEFLLALQVDPDDRLTALQNSGSHRDLSAFRCCFQSQARFDTDLNVCTFVSNRRSSPTSSLKLDKSNLNALFARRAMRIHVVSHCFESSIDADHSFPLKFTRTARYRLHRDPLVSPPSSHPASLTDLSHRQARRPLPFDSTPPRWQVR